MNQSRHAWTLRRHLTAMLVLTMLLTFAVAGGAILAYRVPEVERQTQRALQDDAAAIGERLALLLSFRQVRLELMDSLLDRASPEQADAQLERGLQGKHAFTAIYRLSPDGRVLSVGLPSVARDQRRDLLGSDLSGNALFRAMAPGVHVAWSGRHLSPLSGERTVGVALRSVHGTVLMAELPLSALVETVAVAAGSRAAGLWIVDRSGEVLAQAGPVDVDGPLNIRDWPFMRAILQGGAAPTEFQQGNDVFHAAVSYSETLRWYIVARAPQGLHNPEVQRLLVYVLASFFGCLVTGLVVAPRWADRVARPLQDILVRAQQGLLEQADARVWPRGAVAEFNALSSELETMARVLRERDQKSLAIFNAAPVPMSVVEDGGGNRLLDVNEAWCRELRHARDKVLGRAVTDIGLGPLEGEHHWFEIDGDDSRGETRVLRGRWRAHATAGVRPSHAHAGPGDFRRHGRRAPACRRTGAA